MNVRTRRAVLLALSLSMLLGACAVREQRPEGEWLEERQSWFENYPDWRVTGRLSVSDGEQGGQMAFDWRGQGSQHDLRLRSVVGGKQWRLMFNEGGALIEGSDVGLVRAEDPDLLVAEIVGWPIPVSQLAYWLRGLTASEDDRVSFAADGTMDMIGQDDWTLEYLRYDQPASGPLMPERVQALSPPYRVRMILRTWRWMDPAA
ncbi:lipoprotein insertase outer membrane protein LolB [Wenzhouxiangella limi]|uniref:Outer-membrane lipoprotein LolB n=1 Tax=Wenzhouxiangella limi TaxID=2707351 RepID=A0A845V2V0_9GAMM|nr:lipoprotein insertase outer membrane protein LolB [Wenzhouxiangella limi]NDY94591.1 outer membrane lipoprotein LolB [Wenzhouxiangella limi]